jgi:hypothetical protein
VRLGLSTEAANYLTRDADIGTLEEIAYLDGKDDVDSIIKRLSRPGGSTTVGTGSNEVTMHHAGYAVSVTAKAKAKAKANLKLCVVYLKHQARVNRVPTVKTIALEMVHGFKDQHRWEMDYNTNAFELVINNKYWPQILENIQDYLATLLGVKGSHLDYVVRKDAEVPDAAEDPDDGYMAADQDIIHHAPQSGPAFRNDRGTVWDVMSNICRKHECWIYIKPMQRVKDGRMAYQLLFGHCLGPNNMDNMVRTAEIKFASTLYNGEKKRLVSETYVRIHTDQHAILKA